MNHVHASSKSLIVAIILLTIFTFQQQQLFASTSFSDPNYNNFNTIITNVIEGDTLDNSTEYTSEGCDEGYGYEVDDENPICEPLGQTQEEKENETKSHIFCEALGCPYNPPSPYVS
jgi:hypothetical protein